MQDLQGWWATFAFTGLSISIGVFIVLLLHDRQRRRTEKEKKIRRLLEQYLADQQEQSGKGDRP